MTTTYLYRHFDKDQNLLYVGISRDALERLNKHRRRSEWSNAIKTISIDTFPTRELALAAEEKAFNEEHPKFGHSTGRDWLVSKKINQENALMSDENREEFLTTVDAIIETIGPDRAALKRQFMTVAHKIRHPMRDILAKVPGDNLTNRAKRLGVSRQTMYVWASEKFRPTRVQAKRIAKVTGVPIEHILDDGWEADGDARRKARKKATRVARKRKTTARRAGDASSKRRSKAAARKSAVNA